MTGGFQFSCPKIFCFTLESRLFLSQSPLKRGNWKIFVEMLTVTFKLWLNCAFSVKMFCFKEYKSHFVRQSNLIVPLLWLNRMFYNKVLKTTLKISKFSNFFFLCFHMLPWQLFNILLLTKEPAKLFWAKLFSINLSFPVTLFVWSNLEMFTPTPAPLLVKYFCSVWFK